MKTLKLFLLKRLWMWWINESNGIYLRGTSILDEVWELMYKKS